MRRGRLGLATEPPGEVVFVIAPEEVALALLGEAERSAVRLVVGLLA